MDSLSSEISVVFELECKDFRRQVEYRFAVYIGRFTNGKYIVK